MLDLENCDEDLLSEVICREKMTENGTLCKLQIIQYGRGTENKEATKERKRAGPKSWRTLHARHRNLKFIF